MLKNKYLADKPEGDNGYTNFVTLGHIAGVQL